MTADVHEPLRADLFHFLDLQVDAINFEDLANRIVRRFGEAVDAEICTLWRRVTRDGEDRLELSASVGFEVKPGETIKPYALNWSAKHNGEIEGVTAWIAIRNQFCAARSYDDLVYNAEQPWYGSHRGRWDAFQFMMTGSRFRSLLGIPLSYGDTIIGVLKAENCRRSDAFGPSEIALAEDVAKVLALMLESMNRREQLVQIRQRALYQLSSVLPTLELPKFYQKVVDTIAELVNADVCSLWLVEDDTLAIAANIGIRQNSNPPTYKMNREAPDEEIDGLTAWVAIRQKRVLVTKYEEFANYKAHRGKWDFDQWVGRPEEKFGCLYAVPLLGGSETIGVLKIENARGKPVFGEIETTTFDLMAGFIAVAVELNRRLRLEVVFDFFHNLHAPASTAVMAHSRLRAELKSVHIRFDRVNEWLKYLADALTSIRGWTRNLHTLATVPNFRTGEPSVVQMKNVIENVTDEIRLLHPDFDCDADLDDTSLRLTPSQQTAVEVIFFNLLDNSYKYSNEPRYIGVKARAEEKYVDIVVSDRGRGIPEQDLPNVFRRGFRGSNALSDYGIGFGLSTVHRLITDLGGDIHVETPSTGGTRMVLKIPIAGGA